MATERDIEESLGRMEADLAGFISASLVDLESGIALATRTKDPTLDVSEDSAFKCEFIKLQLRTMQSLNTTNRLEDILFTLSDEIHLLRLLNNNTFLFVAANKRTTNLAVLRRAVIKYSQDLV